LPFGYYLERHNELLILRCADGSVVAAFLRQHATYKASDICINGGGEKAV